MGGSGEARRYRGVSGGVKGRCQAVSCTIRFSLLAEVLLLFTNLRGESFYVLLPLNVECCSNHELDTTENYTAITRSFWAESGP